MWLSVGPGHATANAEEAVSEVPNEDSLNAELAESLNRCRALVDEYRDRLGPEEGEEPSESGESSVLGFQAGPSEQL